MHNARSEAKLLLANVLQTTLEIPMWNANLNAKLTMIVPMTRLVCLNAAEIHAQDLVERVPIVVWLDIILYVAVLLDIPATHWSLVVLLLQGNPWRPTLVIRIHAGLTVKNVKKKITAFVLANLDT